MPLLSVIIVNYNAGSILQQTVQPLLNLEAIGEVFVVDNGSVDNSMDAIERLADSQPKLHCIKNGENIGFAKACNIAISLTGESDYLLFLNPDCIINNNALEMMLACMKSFPHAGIAGPLLLNTNGSEQAGGRRAVPTPWRSFVRAFGLSRLSKRYPRLFSDFLLHKQPLPDGPVELEAISGSCMLVRRAAILDVGLLDEGYFLHCEDLDWCMRFRKRGWKIMFVPDAHVIHHKGTCSRRRPIFVEWHKHKGMLHFYRKFFRHQYPGILFWMVGFGVWLRFGIMALGYSLRHINQWSKHGRL